MPHMNDILVDRLTRSWSEVIAVATNTVSTNTHSALEGAKHVVTQIHVSKDTHTLETLVELKFGSTVVWRGYTDGRTLTVNMELFQPTANQDITLETSKSDTNEERTSTLMGYTVDDIT